MPSILAVDDSASLLRMVSVVLGSAGFDVVEATDGVDALEKASTHAVDLVLTDQNMPRLDGLGLVRALRSQPRFAHTPIVVLTTEASEQMKEAGREAGASGWLVKPCNPAQLVAVIQKLLPHADKETHTDSH